MLILLLPIGAAQAVAASGQGQLAMARGAPRAAIWNFMIGAVALFPVVALLEASAVGRLSGPEIPLWAWSGGVIAAVYLVTSSSIVQHIGVLRLYLGVVSGQFATALLLDLVIPTPEGPVTVARLCAVLLVSIAAVVASRRPRTPDVLPA